MKTAYRVRFAAGSKYQSDSSEFSTPISSGLSTTQLSEQGQKSRSRSRFGCQECKTRRVKCDERFPVCLRCQRRGSLCLSAAPPSQWQAETPWTITRRIDEPWPGLVNPNKRLLHFWFSNGSRMMTVRPENNPLSFPLVEHLLSTPSLVHAVQSISAGQERFFNRSAVQTCLRERGLAIQALQRELQDPSQIKPVSLKSVFLLGISWSWTEDRPRCYGKEHFSGARALLDKMLGDDKQREDSLIQYILGWYIHWDMSCAFIADPDGIYPFHTAGALTTMRTCFHPMIGYSAALFSLLASLGRYCRQRTITSVRDVDLEASFEEQLLAWEPAHGDKTLENTSSAYRNHGLIMLYKVCERPYLPKDWIECWEQSLEKSQTTRSLLRCLALESLKMMLETPADASCIHLHSIPLLTAGAELDRDDTKLRVDVVNRFKAIYSTTRVAVNIWAIDLLEELWELRDSGILISWLELLLSKGLTLNFA